MKPSYKKHRDFIESQRVLFQKGGPFQTASKKVHTVIYNISCPEINPLGHLKVTNHGEKRIKKCVKYALNDRCRLITIQDSGVILLCFVGDHDACDSWLNRNRGLTLFKDDHGRIDQVPTNIFEEGSLSELSALTKGKLFEKLPEDYFDRLIEGIPRQTVRKLEDIESINDESDIGNLVKVIDDNEQAKAVYDVFSLLRQDKQQEALDRTKVFLGEVRTIDQLTEEEIRKLADSKNIKTLDGDDPRFPAVFDRFVKSANYMDWMLFLHPDQQNLVDADHKGPAKLSGVSGSGKTCIVVHRAIRLAGKYTEKILILTLNRQLASLIGDMVDAACPADIRQYIEVMPFFKLCQNLLHQFEPENDKLYDDTTWKNQEHVDEIWREFYRCELNADDAKVLIPLHDTMLVRGVAAEAYIREEMDWLRCAIPPTDRKQYIEIKREGRGYPLDVNFRNMVIDGLGLWEKKMNDVGVTDYLGLSTALYPHKEKIKNSYRSIIVDETQDFGTIELELIRCLVGEDENDMFFCGDESQQVSTKHLSFKSANITIPSVRSLKIRKNYRNSREILKAAYDVLNNHMTEEMLKSDDFEIMDPEYANFSASVPLILKAENLEQEILFSLRYIREYLENNSGKKGCLAFSGYSLYQIQHFGDNHDIKVLNGGTKIEKESIYLSDLEHTKGFEFDVMVVVNCSEHIIPDQYKPEEEQYRDLLRLYVSMTRAKDQLILSYSNWPSQYLSADDNFLSDEWTNYVESDSHKPLGVPSTLNQIRGERHHDQGPLSMNGIQFLYTNHALGLSRLLIEKLRTLITGKNVMRDGIPIQWKNIESAKSYIDIATNFNARRVFGPEGLDQFKKLLEEI